MISKASARASSPYRLLPLPFGEPRSNQTGKGKRGMSITKLLLVTNRWPFGSQFPKVESLIGDQTPMPLLILPFCVGLGQLFVVFSETACSTGFPGYSHGFRKLYFRSWLWYVYCFCLWAQVQTSLPCPRCKGWCRHSPWPTSRSARPCWSPRQGWPSISLSLSLSLYIYIYTHIHDTYYVYKVCVYIYIYMYINVICTCVYIYIYNIRALPYLRLSHSRLQGPDLEKQTSKSHLRVTCDRGHISRDHLLFQYSPSASIQISSPEDEVGQQLYNVRCVRQVAHSASCFIRLIMLSYVHPYTYSIAVHA